MTTKLENMVSLITTSSGSPKIYAYEKPSTNNNCIVYKQISSLPVRNHQGTQFEKTRIQFDVWGDTFSKSRTLANKVKLLLENNLTTFIISYLVNDFTEKDTETGLFRTVLEVFIW